MINQRCRQFTTQLSWCSRQTSSTLLQSNMPNCFKFCLVIWFCSVSLETIASGKLKSIVPILRLAVC